MKIMRKSLCLGNVSRNLYFQEWEWREIQTVSRNRVMILRSIVTCCQQNFPLQERSFQRVDHTCLVRFRGDNINRAIYNLKISYYVQGQALLATERSLNTLETLEGVRQFSLNELLPPGIQGRKSRSVKLLLLIIAPRT